MYVTTITAAASNIVIIIIIIIIIIKVKLFPLHAMNAHEDVNARIRIFASTALGRGKGASPRLGRFYPRGKPSILIF